MTAVSSRMRASPLPLHRLPRKAARRLFRDVLVACTVWLFLLLLVRDRHAMQQQPGATESKWDWPTIEPRHGVKEVPEIPRNLYYMRKEDVMYCYIPKNACSRFKPLLRKREGFADWADRRMIHGMKNGLLRLMWLERGPAMRRLRDGGVRKFVIVRDPFSRLVSAYQNKIATPWPDQRSDFWNKHLRKECPGMVDSLTMPKEGPLMSLEDFLKCLIAMDSLEPSNEHWRPQTELCALDFIKYDRYLHLESLPGDAAELLDYLEWKENATAFQMQRNPVYSRELKDYFSNEALHLTLKYYEQDFAVLKYPRLPAGRIDFYSVFDGTNLQPGFVPPVDFQP